jgi:hypothetical protein
LEDGRIGAVEDDTDFRTGKGDDLNGLRQEGGVSVEEEMSGVGEVEALGTGHCDSAMARCVRDRDRRLTGDKPESPFRTGGRITDKAGGEGEGRNAEAVRDAGRDSVGVGAVVVNKGGEASDFRGKEMVGGLRVDGVVEILEGIAEKDDKLNAGVSGDRDVNVTSGHAVELVDDETAGTFEERNLKRGNSPIFRRVLDAEVLLLPFSAEFSARNGDTRGGEEPEGAKRLRERGGFATTCKAGEMDDGDRAVFKERGSVVKGEETFDERGPIGLRQLAENAVEASLEISAEIGNVPLRRCEGVRALERKTLAGGSDEAKETLDLLSGPGGSRGGQPSRKSEGEGDFAGMGEYSK